jgi:hypothetical protein
MSFLPDVVLGEIFLNPPTSRKSEYQLNGSGSSYKVAFSVEHTREACHLFNLLIAVLIATYGIPKHLRRYANQSIRSSEENFTTFPQAGGGKKGKM